MAVDVIKWNFTGDVQTGKSLMGFGLNQLNILKNDMNRNSLQQSRRTTQLPDGSVVSVWSVFGEHRINIDCQVATEKVDKRKEDYTYTSYLTESIAYMLDNYPVYSNNTISFVDVDAGDCLISPIEEMRYKLKNQSYDSVQERTVVTTDFIVDSYVSQSKPSVITTWNDEFGISHYVKTVEILYVRYAIAETIFSDDSKQLDGFFLPFTDYYIEIDSIVQSDGTFRLSTETATWLNNSEIYRVETPLVLYRPPEYSSGELLRVMTTPDGVVSRVTVKQNYTSSKNKFVKINPLYNAGLFSVYDALVVSVFNYNSLSLYYGEDSSDDTKLVYEDARYYIDDTLWFVLSSECTLLKVFSQNHINYVAMEYYVNKVNIYSTGMLSLTTEFPMHDSVYFIVGYTNNEPILCQRLCAVFPCMEVTERMMMVTYQGKDEITTEIFNDEYPKRYLRRIQ